MEFEAIALTGGFFHREKAIATLVDPADYAETLLSCFVGQSLALYTLQRDLRAVASLDPSYGARLAHCLPRPESVNGSLPSQKGHGDMQRSRARYTRVLRVFAGAS